METIQNILNSISSMFYHYKTTTMGIIVIGFGIWFGHNGKIELCIPMVTVGVGLINSKDADR